MKQPKNSLELPEPTADTRKIQNKLTTVCSAEKNLEIKTIQFCHVAKVKAAMSAHSIYS